MIEELKGFIYDGATPLGTSCSENMRLLRLCVPSKVIAVSFSCASHRQFVAPAKGGFTAPGGKPFDRARPPIIAKYPTRLMPDGADIVIPEGATDVYF